MAPDKDRRNMGGIFVLPEAVRGAKPRVEEARRGGLLGADRAGGW